MSASTHGDNSSLTGQAPVDDGEHPKIPEQGQTQTPKVGESNVVNPSRSTQESNPQPAPTEARNPRPASEASAQEISVTPATNQQEDSTRSKLSQILPIPPADSANNGTGRVTEAFPQQATPIDSLQNPSSSIQDSRKGQSTSPDLREVVSVEFILDDQDNTSTSSANEAQSPVEPRFSYMMHRNTNSGDQNPITEGTFSRDEIKCLDLSEKENAIVIFLPSIPELLDQPNFIDELVSKFGIDPFFLTQTAYDSNGFFRGSTAESSVGCRFLVKELNKIDSKPRFDKVRQDLYNLVPDTLKERLNPFRSITDSDIVSLPDDSNETLLRAFASKFESSIRGAISKRILNEKKVRSGIQKRRHFKGSQNPAQPFDWNASHRRNTSQDAQSYTASYSLSASGDEKVQRYFAQASNYKKKFLKMLENLAISRDPSEACSVLGQWMSNKDEAQLVLLSVMDLCLEKNFNFLGFIDKMLIIIYHRSNCILEDGLKPTSVPMDSSPSRKVEPGSNNQNTKIKAQANRKLQLQLKPKSESEIQTEERPKPRDINQIYHWFFFFFWIRTFTQPSDGFKTQVMLCFDDSNSPKMKKIIWSILGKGRESWDTPEKLLYRITEQVVRIFDTALWGFRVPVRGIEKKRSQLEGNVGSSSAIYFSMHELLRHLIHSQETLAATEQVLEAALMESTSSDTYILRFCLTFVKNLRLRASAFVQRLNNELSLAYHINNAKQLESVDGLLKQGQDDGRDVAKFVGYATIFFLPGTFISGFFSMTFFGFDAERSAWGHSAMVWVWFVVTIPVTVIGVILFSWRHSKKTFGQFVMSGLDRLLFWKEEAEASEDE